MVVGTGGAGEPEASDSMRTFGAMVQALREHAGLSREQLGEHVRYSKHMVASVEIGRRLPPPDFVERADPVLGDTGVLRKSVPHVVRRPGLARWFREWARLEAEAIALYTYECRVIPGLLQSEAYARTLFGHRLPPLDDEEIEAQWSARAQRQRLLVERAHTAFSFVVEEHQFVRRMGGDEVTRGLIDHVLEMAELRNVEVQIMPLVRDTHAGTDGPTQLLETPENRWYAYNEGQESGQLISDPKVVSVLQRRYARMCAQALSPEDSASLLQRMRGAL
ncbi:helix-turn-helix transcriptional regulator [Streptomyces sp. WMMC500]|uniref:helix-turn-helix domain-containing protein n=1 Tax=Streptomyces sp. WMMC500 TaxID=3015154 RepID=UPI00248CCEC3|nr:helix-turn-helix transcriptional regulator [Streptomyces sp. WMMC500]WBB64492.1 helix-turn-helix transcriptional regulator [Streptomyces sp. WMMC500]